MQKPALAKLPHLLQRRKLTLTQELPHDQEFQKKMLRDTFMHFLQKKFASDEKYFDQLEEECNQIIWEDMTK
jgi:hypothetical protein